MAQLNQFFPLRSLLPHSKVTRQEVLAFQNKQLARLVTHAYNHVPYYRKLFDSNGLKPKDIRTVTDLPAIPPTSKKDLQLLPAAEIVASGVNLYRLIVHKTSGASGEPFVIRRTWFEERLLGAFRLRALRNYGLRWRDQTAAIAIVERPHSRDDQFPSRILQKAGLYRRMIIDCLLTAEKIVRVLRDSPPDVLSGFPGVLDRVACAVGESDHRILHPRFIVAGGEVLTPSMRRRISEAFRAPVFDTYGSHEFNLIAWQCKETGEFHTCDDEMILEVLNNGRPATPGERGEVVGTNLHSFAMPFIRYRLGDLVTKGSETCPCGQPFSTIKTIQGRMIDYFVLPGGGVIHPYEIVLILLDESSWIKQYKLLQVRLDHIVLQAVPFTTPSAEHMRSLKDRITKRVGSGVEVEIALLPQIPLEPSGKFRVSRSLIHSHYEGIDWGQLP